MTISKDLSNKYDLLKTTLQKCDKVLLAYSGGVDSTFLLSALMDFSVKTLAVIADSPTMPGDDMTTAMEMVKQMNVDYKVIKINELEDNKFVENPVDRCFHCKNGLFERLQRIAAEEAFGIVADGSTVDDLSDYRPGFKAKKKHHIRSPLIDAGFTKEDVRAMSRERGLKTWDKPSSPCLSSRFPYGERITEKGLTMVEKAELKLKELGFYELRVRYQGDTARIELNEEDIPVISEIKMRREIVSYFREIGFIYVTLDLEGYKSGKLNRAVPNDIKNEVLTQ